MTIQEIHTDFRYWLDRQSTGVTPSVQIEDIDLVINDSVEKYIKNKYRPIKRLLSRNVGFEEIQKRIDDLSKLVISANLTVQEVTDEPGIYYTDLDSLVDASSKPNYMFFLRGRVKISSEYRPTRLVRHSELDIVPLDPFNKTSERKPVIYFESNQIRIMQPSGVTFEEFRITYIRNPIEVSYDDNLTIDLNSHTHREIVQQAVSDTLRLFESKRSQEAQQDLINVE